MSDTHIIREYIKWCEDRGINQSAMAIMVNRSKGWASLLVQGKIKKLHFDTKAQILRVMGKKASDVMSDGC